VLEAQPPSAELAAAYQIQAHLLMLNRDNAEAIERGMQAIGLAERLGAEDALIYAHNSVGSAMLLAGDNEGVTFLERSVQMAVEAGLDDYAVAAYGNLGSASGEMYRFEQADRYLAEGITYCADRDLDFERNYMLAWQALSHFYQGRWTEAGEVASTLLRLPNLAAISQIMAQVALGRVRARRGDPEVMNVLDEALDAARRTATLQRLGPVHAARAEAAWLTGESEAAAAEAHSAYDLAIRQGHPWFIGELAYWRWKAGDLDSPPALAAEPFKLQMRGDWAAAAARWQALNCPYEAARALAESDDEAALRRAFDDFDRLGAMPARAEVAQRLRELGAQAIPRGARPATRANPAGLTARQVEVARLVAEGCSNAEIAKRLFISHKTVEHHISALFAKLGVESRRNAARAAVRLGINLTDPESDR
jgi:DNA-binding CsgD family transcriptional regulator